MRLPAVFRRTLERWSRSRDKRPLYITPNDWSSAGNVCRER
jgi:hypothetical protein